MHERITREIALLEEGGQRATLIPAEQRSVVIYHDVPTAGQSRGLPTATDVLVPVPGGYPAAPIDLAALPSGSPLLSLVKGGPNCQGVIQVDGRSWQLASYHPHGNGGGPPWDPMQHGFHTYLDHLLAWLRVLA